MNDATDQRADRYGGPLVGTRTAKILLGIAAAVFLTVVVYVGVQSASTPVRSDVVSYEHLADDVIGVDILVTMDPGTEASCQIQALNEGRAQVGFVEAVIPAQDSRQTTHHVEIATQGQAVSAEIVRCSPL